MKYLYVSVLLLLALAAGPSFAQDNQADQMKKWQEYMTPGDMHKMMSESVGDWTFKMKMWMDPAAEPQSFEGTNTNQMLFGGRYLLCVAKGDMMGMPFEGHLMQGYDNLTKEFTAVWIDNMGTGVAVLKGTYDAATKTLTVKGPVVEPMTGKEIPVRQTLLFKDKDHQHMEYFMDYGGKEVKSMEIDYTRK